MDDLVETLRGMLSDPTTANSLSALAKQLGGGDTSAAAPTAPQPTAPPGDLGDMAGMLSTLMPMLSGLSHDDENTTLLRALRPYLHGGREKRLDEAVRLLKLLKFVPLLQGKGGIGLE